MKRLSTLFLTAIRQSAGRSAGSWPVGNRISLLPLTLILLAAVIASGCQNSESPSIEEPDLYHLGALESGGVTVEIYSKEPLFVGYNPIWIEVHRDGEQLEDLEVGLMPMMQMEMHAHSSPREQPVLQRDEACGLFRGAVIFTMPSGEMGSWELRITVRDGDELLMEPEEGIGLEVEESDLVHAFGGEDGNNYFLTLIEPRVPKLGSNDLVVTFHRRDSMMDFPPVMNAEIGFEPWMTAPDMDHGSQNNEGPVHEGEGHYRGVVNFNMTGDWELRFDPEVDGVELGHQVMDIRL